MRRLRAFVLITVCVLWLAGCSSGVAFAEPHREDFTPGIEDAVLEQFEDDAEVKKVYRLRTDAWYLMDDLTDFSQAVTTDVMYVIPGGEKGTHNDLAYSTYGVDEEGEIRWGSSAYPPADAPVPYGFSGLTYDVIEDALDEFDYEDYIITYDGQNLSTVFVWVRCAQEDVIITYPTRPDLLGIEIGEICTLEEVRRALADAYDRNEGSFF